MKTSINRAELIQLGACKRGFDVFVSAHADKETRFSECLEINGLDGVLWLIEELEDQFSDSQRLDLHRFACDCALINIELIKPYCSESDYGLIVSYLKNPADDKAWAASAAASAAARSAALAAASAAWEAWSAALAAANAAWKARAARAAKVSKESEKQVTELLVNVFKKWEGEL